MAVIFVDGQSHYCLGNGALSIR